MTKRDVVFPAGRQALYERNRYSPAIRSNGFLFVSGQVGSREDGSPEPDLEAQVRLAFDNLVAILKAAGCTFDDVVDVTVFMVDPQSTFETAWKVVPEFWGSARYEKDILKEFIGDREINTLGGPGGPKHCHSGPRL